MTEDVRQVLGILYPGHSAEDDYPRAAARIRPAVAIPVIHTTVGVDTHEIEAFRDTGAPFRLDEGADRLLPSHPDAAMWACTSGSFVFGLAGARAQARRVADRLGVPVSSTSLAFLSALRALGARRVAIGATYPDDLTDLFRVFLEEDGFEVLRVGTLGIMDASEGGPCPARTPCPWRSPTAMRMRTWCSCPTRRSTPSPGSTTSRLLPACRCSPRTGSPCGRACGSLAIQPPRTGRSASSSSTPEGSPAFRPVGVSASRSGPAPTGDGSRR